MAEVTEETQEQTEVQVENNRPLFSERGAEFFQNILQQQPNLVDLMTVNKLALETIYNSVLEHGDLEPEQIQTDLMLEMSNALSMITDVLITNKKIEKALEGKPYGIRYRTFQDIVEYKEDDTIIIIDTNSREVKANKEGVTKEFIDKAHERIEAVVNELREEMAKEEIKVKEDSE